MTDRVPEEQLSRPTSEGRDATTDCRICDGNLVNPLTVREMMFGTGEEFTYLTCADCGCMQIDKIPENMDKYYSNQYFSFKENNDNIEKKRLKNNKKRFRSWTFRRHFKFLSPAPKTIFQRLGYLGIHYDDGILDVGSGAGGLVRELRETGFRRVLGIDPFLEHDSRDRNGEVLAKKAGIFDIEGTWRLIMFNHSFEHMDSQNEVLRRCRALLDRAGYVLICIPTVSSWAFRTYGPDWVQLDAPRHFYLHSRKSIDHLARSSGFRLSGLWDDSAPFQFVGSEQNRQGIPLMGDRSLLVNPDQSIFSPSDLRKFRKMANELNRKGEGDQFCALLEPV